MSVTDSPGGRLVRWIGSWATVIAPATVLGALLFYFGYISARSQYEYFGIDVDTIGLSTQDYVMRSPQPLLVPLLVLTLLAVALLVLDLWVSTRMVAAGVLWRLPRILSTVGATVLGTGVVLLFSYPLVRDWPYYNLVTPVLFAVGAGLVGYAWRLSDVAQRLREHQPSADSPASAPAARSPDSSLWLRRTARMLVYIMIIAGVFWTTATVAQWAGRGQARDQARHLDTLPRVILDTKEPLYLRSPGVEERVLPTVEGQTFHYRYRNLRLLIVGRDRMFLVPEQWSASNSTLVVPLDGSVRIQFQFQNPR